MGAYLDKTGLERLWANMKGWFKSNADNSGLIQKFTSGVSSPSNEINSATYKTKVFVNEISQDASGEIHVKQAKPSTSVGTKSDINHKHGGLDANGAIAAGAIDTNKPLVVYDSSNKLIKSGLMVQTDSTYANKYLLSDGTWGDGYNRVEQIEVKMDKFKKKITPVTGPSLTTGKSDKFIYNISMNSDGVVSPSICPVDIPIVTGKALKEHQHSEYIWKAGATINNPFWMDGDGWLMLKPDGEVTMFLQNTSGVEEDIVMQFVDNDPTAAEFAKFGARRGYWGMYMTDPRDAHMGIDGSNNAPYFYISNQNQLTSQQSGRGFVNDGTTKYRFTFKDDVDAMCGNIRQDLLDTVGYTE